MMLQLMTTQQTENINEHQKVAVVTGSSSSTKTNQTTEKTMKKIGVAEC